MQYLIHFYAVHVFIVLLITTTHGATGSVNSLQAAQQLLPSCAYSCFEKLMKELACHPSLSCISKSERFEPEITACVESACTIKETLITKNVTYNVFGKPIRDHTNVTLYTSLIGGVVASSSFLLRVVARVPLPYWKGAWGPDDWAMVVTMIPIIPLTALSNYLARYGLGRDIWMVPFDRITAILHIYYFEEILYLISVTLTKISIMLFYRRIFPISWLQTSVKIMLALCVCYIISFVIAIIFQCIPVSGAWRHWSGESHAKCINLNLEGWVSSGLNILFDLIIIILPMKPLWNLKMSQRKKIQVTVMFAGGFFITIVSCVRLHSMIQFANSNNVTWDYTSIGYWSTIEVHLGVVVACLPAVQSLPNRFRHQSRINNTSYYIVSNERGNGSGRSGTSILSSQRRHTDIFEAVKYKRSPEHIDEELGLNHKEETPHNGSKPKSPEEWKWGLSTQIQRGSIIMDNNAPVSSARGGWNVPTPSFPKSSRSSRRSLEVMSGMRRGIQVKTDYSVTSEPATVGRKGRSTDIAAPSRSRGRNGEVTEEEILEFGRMRFSY